MIEILTLALGLALGWLFGAVLFGLGIRRGRRQLDEAVTAAFVQGALEERHRIRESFGVTAAERRALAERERQIGRAPWQ